MLLETVVSHIIGFINTAVLSGYSETSVAAVGSANKVINFFPIIFSVVSTGSTVIISNMIGAERIKKAYTTTFAQISLCFLLGLTCSVLMLTFAEPVITFMNLKGAVYDEALTYYRIRASFLAITAISSGLSAILRCFGHAKNTVIVNFITITISLLLNVFVIKCPDISPVTGVAGIATATIASQVVSLVLYIYFIRRKNIKFIRPKSIKIFWGYTKKILGIGIPTGISGSTYSFSQIISASFIALIGTYALNAHTYYNNILCYAYLFSISLGNANSLLVGRLIGAGEIDKAKKLCKTLVKLTVTINLLVSLTALILHKPLVGIFTDNPLIIKTAAWVFAIDIVAELSRGVSQVYEYALRAAGDMKFMLAVLMCSCWLISVGLSYFLALPCGLGIIGFYIGTSIDELIRASAAVYRWRSNKWNFKKGI